VEPQPELAGIIVMVEVIIGYVVLGGLIPIPANELARRASIIRTIQMGLGRSIRLR
jgi:hypothetical protein